jgi:hypothetical protein
LGEEVVTLEVLVDSLRRQLRQVELYQGRYWCERIESGAVVGWQAARTDLDEDALVG